MTSFDLAEVERELEVFNQGRPRVATVPNHVHAVSTPARVPQGGPPPRRQAPPLPTHRSTEPPVFGGPAYPPDIQQALDESDPASRAAFEHAQQRQRQQGGPAPRVGGGVFGDAAHVDETVLRASRPSAAVDPEFAQTPMIAPGFRPPPAPLEGPPAAVDTRRGAVRPLSTEPLPIGPAMARPQALLVAEALERLAETHRLMHQQLSELAALLRQSLPVDDDGPQVTAVEDGAPVTIVPPIPSPPAQETPPNA